MPKEIPGDLFPQVPAAGWTQWFLFLGLIEKGLYTFDPTRAPGDYKNAGLAGVSAAIDIWGEELCMFRIHDPFAKVDGKV